MREKLSYCVILPAYNESRHLATVVGRVPDWVDGIIIVDDASTDDTLRVAESLTLELASSTTRRIGAWAERW
jgi:glycosyltransferase involved in cell wall biosynthesis